jgi:hypothetical protein
MKDEGHDRPNLPPTFRRSVHVILFRVIRVRSRQDARYEYQQSRKLNGLHHFSRLFQVSISRKYTKHRITEPRILEQEHWFEIPWCNELQ